jgi:hypothetical protein
MRPRTTTRAASSPPVYSHRKPYPTAAGRPRIPHLGDNETAIRHVFASAYQALADTFRSEAFTSGFHPSDTDAWFYVSQYLDSASQRAVDGFQRVLQPVANIGGALGERELSNWRDRFRFRKGGNAATVLDPRRLPERGLTPATDGRIIPLYPGSYPPQVPPRRQLLRIPNAPLAIQPATRDGGLFVGAPQVHLDAIAQLPIDLVYMIDESQREGIRQVLDEAIRMGYPPDMIAMQIANMVGLFPRWQNAVLKVQNTMVEKGYPPKEIDYRVGRYSDWLRERRGIMIARTEMMTALNVGRMNGWKQQAEQGFLDTALSEKEWLSAPGACEWCTALNGQRVQGIDGTFDTHFGPRSSGPCHPHCRCVTLIHPVRRPDQYLDSVDGTDPVDDGE